MSSTSAATAIATIDIDLGKNTFHLVGLDRRGAIAAFHPGPEPVFFGQHA